METQKNVIEVLNDLIEINNDRVEGYAKAAEAARENNQDLLSIFDRMKKQSAEYVNQLSNHVMQAGGKPRTGTTISGKLYRGWMDVKNAFTSNDRLSILSSCERGEDAMQSAYKAALTENIPGNIRELIVKQKNDLKLAHDEMKEKRDMEKAHA